jgi:hypothetical protein
LIFLVPPGLSECLLGSRDILIFPMPPRPDGLCMVMS